jgi:hypothetical protein
LEVSFALGVFYVVFSSPDSSISVVVVVVVVAATSFLVLELDEDSSSRPGYWDFFFT